MNALSSSGQKQLTHQGSKRKDFEKERKREGGGIWRCLFKGKTEGFRAATEDAELSS